MPNWVAVGVEVPVWGRFQALRVGPEDGAHRGQGRRRTARSSSPWGRAGYAMAGLEFYGNRFAERRVAEDGEPFVYGQVDGLDIEIWLYPDEAEYRAGKKRRNYEVAVFGDERQTITSFVADVARELM
jgi:hypothetical protein